MFQRSTSLLGAHASAASAAAPVRTNLHPPRDPDSTSASIYLRPAAGGEEAIPLALRLDRHDAASGEATYVSTAAARLAPPAAAFEVADHRGAALLRGSLRRCPDAKAADSPAWEIDCVPAAGAAASASAFEVYVAGCCGGEPAVLTRALRLATPEEAAGGLVRRGPGALTVSFAPRSLFA